MNQEAHWLKTMGSSPEYIVTIQQVCALTALTVRKHSWKTKIPSAKLIWNGFLHVTTKVLNSYDVLMKAGEY